MFMVQVCTHTLCPRSSYNFLDTQYKLSNQFSKRQVEIPDALFNLETTIIQDGTLNSEAIKKYRV